MPAPGPLRILIADDHDLTRRGLKALIESHPGWTVCAEASTGREAVELARRLKPDIAVLDVRLREFNGIETARQLRKILKATEVLLLSAYYSEQLLREAIEAGVRGCILKSDAGRDALLAIEALARQKPFFGSGTTQGPLRDSDGRAVDGFPEAVAGDALTSREREILQLLAEGKTSKGVAIALTLSVKTVETHRANIMRKLKLANVADLVRYAIRNLIIEP